MNTAMERIKSITNMSYSLFFAKHFQKNQSI